MSANVMSLVNRVSGIRRRLSRLLSERGSLGQRLLGGAFWLTVGGVASSGATLVCSVVLARQLGISRFGQYSILASTLGIFTMFSGPSLGWTATKFISENREKDPGYATRIMTLTNLMALAFSGLCAAVLALGSGRLAGEVLRAPALRPALLMGSILLLFTGINGAQRGALAGFEAFKAVAVVNVFNGALMVGLVVLLARRHGIAGAVAGQGLAVILTCAAGYLVLKKITRNHRMAQFARPRWEDLRVFRGYTVPYYLISTLSMASSWMVGVLVFHGRNGAYEMGIFGITNQVFLAGMFLPSMICQPCLPILAEQIRPGVTGRAAVVRKVIRFSVLISLGVAVAQGGAIYLWGRPILGIFGKGLEVAMPLLAITLMTTLIATAQGPLNYFMSASGHAWLGFALSALSMAGNLGTILALESRGALAATWARLVSFAILTPILVWYYRYRLRRLGGHEDPTV